MGTGWEGLLSPSALAAFYVIFGSERERVISKKGLESQYKRGSLYTDGLRGLFLNVSGQ